MSEKTLDKNMQKNFSGTLGLTAFFIRREKILFVIWLAVLLILAWAIALVFENHTTPEELQALLIVRTNPAQMALQGPVYGAESFLPGFMFAAEMHLLTMVGIAIMNIFMVNRLTRADEEKGRHEVIRSLPVGRLAGLNAAMITAFFANLILAVSHGLLLWAIGITGIDVAGAFAYGLNLAILGFFFAALTAFFAQLSPTARGTTGYAFAFLIVAYLLRAVGDNVSEGLAMVSPLGLIMRAEVFVNNYIWPVLIMLALTFIVCAVAYMLDARRDMDQGFIPVRQGSAEGSAFMGTPAGLAWRLSRNTFIAWAIGMLTLGVSLGGLLGEAEDFAADTEIIMAVLPQSPDFSVTQLFTMMLNIILAIVCIAPVISLALKPLAEEKDNRAEYILGAAVSRTKYIGCYGGIAFLASLVMPFITALGLWMVGVAVMYEPIAFGTMLQAMIVYVPALWVMMGLCIFVIGVLPKAALLCWAYFGYTFVAGFFGELLRMPEWAIRLSPIGFVPMLPLEDVQVVNMLGLTAVAAVLVVCGLVFYRRRDLG